MEVRAYAGSPTVTDSSLKTPQQESIKTPNLVIASNTAGTKKKTAKSTKISSTTSKATKSKTASRTSLKKASKDALDEILDKQAQIIPQTNIPAPSQDIENLLRAMDPHEMAKDKAFKEIAFIFDAREYQGDVHYSRDGDAGFYTQENEKKRFALKSNPMVQEAINSVMDVYSFERDGTLTKPNYVKVNACIAKILRQDLKENLALRLVEEDWKNDSNGKGNMNKQEVFDSLFELGDMWTPNIDAYQFVVFFEKIAKLLKGKEELPNSKQKVAVIA